MSKKSAKRRLSFDDSDSSIIDHISPGPSKSTTSHALNDDELLALLQDSDFENKNFDFDSEEDDDDEYIVEENTEVPLQSPNGPNHTTQNISSDSLSDDLLTGHPSRVIQPQNQQVWTPTPKNAPLIPFDGSTGMLQVPTSDEPIDFFLHLFTDDMFNLIVTETNRQGKILCSQNTKSKSRIKNWKNITRDDMEIFLGLIFFTGHISAPTISHYWQTNDLYNFNVFRNAMSRDRFLLILRCLHFTENPPTGGPKPNDPLYKITPLFDLFHNRMKQVYYPTKELSLDESMLLWRGRLYFRQYIQNKKHKFGIKFYVLTQPDGLVLKTRIYCGSSDPIVGGKGHVDKVVKYLLNDYYGVGHSVYIDNLYNSVEFTEYLLDKNTYVTGTLRGNRKGNPSDVVSKKLKKGELISAYNSKGICVMKWHDKRDVIMISSEFGATMNEYCTKSGKVSEKPESVLKYNQFMGGVDHSDQLMSYYPCERKILRWYAKIALHMFHVIMNNAYILYKQQPGKRNTRLLDFRDSVINKLIYNHRPKIVTPTQRPKKKGLHVISSVPRNTKNRPIRKRCVICAKNQKRVETTYYCNECSAKPGLCLDTCYKIYHGY